MPVQSLGKLINYRELKRIDKDIDYLIDGDCIELRIIHIDRYGNIILPKGFKNIINELNVGIGDTIKIKSKDKIIESVIGVSFESVVKGTPVLYENSYGFIEVAINQGSMQAIPKVTEGDTIKICR